MTIVHMTSDDNRRAIGIRQKFSARGLPKCLECSKNIPVDQRARPDDEPGPDARGRWHRWWCSDRCARLWAEYIVRSLDPPIEDAG